VIQNDTLPAAKAFDIKYADLDQSTRYSRLTLKYIGAELRSHVKVFLRALVLREPQPECAAKSEKAA
jgi:hypothetical protein